MTYTINHITFLVNETDTNFNCRATSYTLSSLLSVLLQNQESNMEAFECHGSGVTSSLVQLIRK
jgi:hypothetical protein